MGATTLQVEPLEGVTFGATVRGVELRSLDDETWQVLHGTWIQYGLLIFPGQFLTREEQDELARRFGDLEFSAAPISNIDKDGNVHFEPNDDVVKSLRGNEGWHHDSTYMPLQAKGAVFSAEIVPTTGADTGWADMRAAYEALDDEMKAFLADKQAYHSLVYSQARSGYLPSDGKKLDGGGYQHYGMQDPTPRLRQLVKVHPDTGRPNLLIGRHAHAIIGLDPDESERLLDELIDTACQPPRVYFHRWEVGDTVIWDNRRLLHRGTPYDMTQPRRMWHTRIAGDPETERALNLV